MLLAGVLAASFQTLSVLTAGSLDQTEVYKYTFSETAVSHDQMQIPRKRVVVHITKEIAPLVTFGGVSQMVGGLSRAQAASGDKEVFVVLPLYAFLRSLCPRPAFRIQVHVAGGRFERVSVCSLSHRASLLGDMPSSIKKPHEWALSTKSCQASSLAGELLNSLKSRRQQQEDSTGLQSAVRSKRRPPRINSEQQPCIHYLLIQPPRRLAQLWQHVTTVQTIYSLPPGIPYSKRDTFFGSAAASLAHAIHSAAKRKLIGVAGHNHSDSLGASSSDVAPTPVQGGHRGRYLGNLQPISVHQAMPRSCDGTPETIAGDQMRQPNTAFKALAAIAAKPWLQKCPATVVHLHGATNSMAAWSLQHSESKLCPISRVYTLHDSSSEVGVSFELQDVLRYTPGSKRHKGQFSNSKASQELHFFNGQVVASTLGMINSNVVTTVSDNLATALCLQPQPVAPWAGVRKVADSTGTAEHILRDVLCALKSQARWVGTPNGLDAAHLPKNDPILRQSKVGALFDTSWQLSQRLHAAGEALARMRSKPEERLNLQMFANNQRLRGGSQASVAHNIPHLDQDVLTKAKTLAQDPQESKLSAETLEFGSNVHKAKTIVKAKVLEYFGCDRDRQNPLLHSGTVGYLHGIDNGREKHDESQHRSRLYILFVGRFERLKGIHLLMRAAEWACHTGHLLFLAGEKSEQDSIGWEQFKRIEQSFSLQVQQMQCKGRIVPMRDRSAQEGVLPLVRAAADIAIVPSVSEAFGFVALEALIHSTIVVASNVGGLPDVVMENVPPERLRGITSPSRGRSLDTGEQSLDTPIDSQKNQNKDMTTFMWTGQLFNIESSEELTGKSFIAALSRAAARVHQLQGTERFKHLAALQFVGHAYSWSSSRGRDSVARRWHTTVSLAAAQTARSIVNASRTAWALGL